MDLGRNEPCHCGSGKKYKKCHLHVDEQRKPLAREVWLARQEAAFAAVWEGNARRTGYESVGVTHPGAGSRWEDEPGWLLFEESIAAAHGEMLLDGANPLEAFLASEDSRLIDPDLVEWLEAEQESWLSVWNVRGGVKGKGLLLVDVFTGATRFIQDPALGGNGATCSVVLGRVVDVGGFSYLAAVHPRGVCLRDQPKVLDELRAALDFPPGSVAEARFRGAAVDPLLVAWEAACAEAERIERARHGRAPAETLMH